MKKVHGTHRFFFLATLILICCAMIVSVISGCSDKKTPESGDEVGTYYFYNDDDQNREYQLILAEGLKFTFLPESGEGHIGSYTLTDGTLTLTDGEWTQTATYNDDETISISYNGLQMRMLRKITYTVTFESNGGSAVADQNVLNGRTVAKPQADPTYAGHKFLGWYADQAFTTPYQFNAMPVTANTTLYACWAEYSADGIEYEISYDLGYEGAETIPSEKTADGKLYAAPTPAEREGYTFAGWWISMENKADRLTYAFQPSSVNGSDGTVFTADTTLFAVWNKNDSQLSAAPAVSVTKQAISWQSVAGASGYLLTVITPDGTSYYDNEVQTSTTVPAGDIFTETGVYRIEVATKDAGGNDGSERAVRYFVNNGLERVSGVHVMEPSTLVYDGVEGADQYLISIDCGNKSHKHTALSNGTSLYFNFANCDMQKGGIKFTIKAVGEGYAPSETTFVYERNLTSVTNADIENDVATWDSVPGAAYYKVECGENTYNITDTKFSFKEMPAGKYTLKVTPVASGFNSPDAQVLEYEKTTPALPSDIVLKDTTLSWTDTDEGATYKVVYNGTSTEVAAGTTSIDLATISGLTWSEEAEYSVQLEVTKNNVSALSDAFTFVYNALKPTLTYKNSVLSWNAVAGAAGYQVRINGSLVATLEDGSTSLKLTSLEAEGANKIEVVFLNELGIASEPATLTVNAQAVTFNSGNSSVTLYKAVGDELTAPQADSLLGYQFDAWYNTPSGPATNGAVYSNPFFAGPGELVLYANYKPMEYNVVYEGDDLGSLTGTVVSYGEDFTLDVPTSTEGTKAFGGWFSSPYGAGIAYTDAYGNSIAPWNIAKDNVKVYAFWVDSVLSFTVYDNQATVSQGPRISLVDTITIPKEYNGSPVTAISATAFAGCTNLTEINIPDTVTTIPVTAFDGCSALENVNVYSTGVSYSRYVSYDGVLYDQGSIGAQQAIQPTYMPSAKTGSYVIPDGVKIIPRSAFANSNISKVTIPASVETIQAEAFANCINLTTVIFTNPGASGSLTIGARAFMNNFSLVSITFPARLTDLAVDRVDDAVLGSFSSIDDITANSSDAFLINKDLIDVENEGDLKAQLEAVNVAVGNNTTYKSVDGVLFRGNTLVYFPEAKSAENYSIPAGITAVGESAFFNTSLSGDLVLPATVTTIGNFAFAGTNIETLRFAGDRLAQPVTVGDYAFYECGDLEKVTFDKKADATETTPATENSNVTVIGVGAFYEDEYLNEITIPASVTSIGEKAFALSYSDSLDITFESGNDATLPEMKLGDSLFYNREIDTLVIPANARLNTGFFNGLEAGTIVTENNPTLLGTDEGGIYLQENNVPVTLLLYYGHNTTTFEFKNNDGEVLDTVTTISAGAFANADGITAVVIPASVTTIGEEAFRGNTEIDTVTFTAGGTAPLSIGNYAFAGMALTTIALPAREITIGDYAFAENKYVTSIELGGTKTIGAHAFEMTGNLEDGDVTLHLTATVETIGESAFEGYSSYYSGSFGISIVTMDADSRLKTIGASAFAQSQITSFTVPATVESIGARAFYGCENLTEITFDDGPTPLTIGDPSGSTDTDDSSSYSVFGGTEIKEFNLPARLEVIGNLAFADMGGYSDSDINVTFAAQSKLESIGAGAFYSSALSEITIPASVTTIGESAFSSSNATAITFAAGGTANLEIGPKAFVGAGIVTLTLPARLTSLGANAFSEGVYYCDALESITVEPGCAAYASKDGVLYSGDFKELILCPTAKQGEVTVDARTEKIDELAFYHCSDVTAVNFEQNSNLKEIGSEAFYFCYGLTTFVIPDSVTTLGETVFLACKYLTSLQLPANLENFSADMLGCENLDEIKIVNGVNYAAEGAAILSADKTELVYYLASATAESYTIPSTVKILTSAVFQNNTHLKSITIPASVEQIGENAFYNCSMLKEVKFDNGTAPLVIGSYAFMGTALESLSLPSRLSSIESNAFTNLNLKNVSFGGADSMLNYIGDSAFSGTDLTTVTLPSGVREIGNRVFADMDYLTNVTLNEGLTTIGDNVFAYGDDYDEVEDSESVLETVTLPSTLENVGSSIFYLCVSLKHVNFAANSQIETLPNDTFLGCVALESIQLPASLTAIAGRDFAEASSDNNRGLFEELPSLTSVTFEEGSKCLEIGAYAFSGSPISSFTIPASVTYIGSYAFYNTAIKEITIPVTVTSLGTGVFTNCSSLEVAYVEANIKVLPALTFQNCKSLTSISLPKSLEEIDESAFSNTTAIRNITIADGNNYFVVDDTSGALFNLEKDTLYLLPAGVTTFKVPATLTSDSFLSVIKESDTLEEVTVEDGNPVFSAEGGVLYKLNEGVLEIVYIPKTTTSIVFSDDLTTLTETSVAELMAATELDTVSVREGSTTTRQFNIAFGAVYSTDWRIMFVPAAMKTFTIPAQLTSIEAGEYVFGSGSYGANTKIETITYDKQTPRTEQFTIGGYKYSYYGIFASMSNLTSVELPAGTSIGQNAFYGSKNLANVTLTAGEDATIGASAFTNTALTKIVIPEGYTSIGESAFSGCSNLASVTLSASENATIGAKAFANTALTELVIPEGYISIDADAFSGLTLENITIPSTMETIDADAFSGADVINVTLNNNDNFKYEGGIFQTADGSIVYFLSSGITTFEIGAAMTDDSIIDLLEGVSTLESVTVAKGNPAFNAKFGALYDSEWTLLFVPKAMTTFTIPVEVTQLGGSYETSGLFEGSSIETVTFEEGEGDALTIAGYSSESVFAGADNLTSVSLPDRTTVIDNYAFKEMSSITSFSYGNAQLTKIGNYAFDSCYGISSFVVTDSVEYVGDSAFQYWGREGKQTIYWPFASTVDPQTSFGWHTYWDWQTGNATMVYTDTVTE